ncbi:MAG TPA: hypothetical protein VF599_02605 [Pyrinomonadaceae bacterium]|jgi:hypothetical protein
MKKKTDSEKKTSSEKKSDLKETKKKSREGLTTSAQESDEHLFVPHIEKLELSRLGFESTNEMYASILRTICGAVDDSQAVEQYNGTLGVTTAFVAAS